MKRKIMADLSDWKSNSLRNQKPYMLIGARQVGKTYILKEFCQENYAEYIYLNFEDNPGLLDVFEESLNPEDILSKLRIAYDFNIDVENTAIFFDEIQVCERAITSLKYFCESDVEYQVVCAGSLLGVAINRLKFSFPVGKVDRNVLYPMDFEEFLWATNRLEMAEEIRKAYIANKALPDVIHRKLIELYKHYLYVGGMPASVLGYLEVGEEISIYDRSVKRKILNDYINDMKKYTTNAENIKIEKVFKSIPKQLGRDNSKFSYKVVEDGARKVYYEAAIDWLIKSAIVTKCSMVALPKIPLVVYEKESYFKIYLCDVGLLTELSELSYRDMISDEARLFSGMLTENYVACMLKCEASSLYYWKSQKDAEIDFIRSINGYVIPIEVKASTNKKSKSLRTYVEKYSPEYSIRVSARNFGFVNKIKSVPLYSAYLIKEKDYN